MLFDQVLVPLAGCHEPLSTRTSTELTPVSSVAEPDTGIEPETVEPWLGALIEMIGASFAGSVLVQPFLGWHFSPDVESDPPPVRSGLAAWALVVLSIMAAVATSTVRIRMSERRVDIGDRAPRVIGARANKARSGHFLRTRLSRDRLVGGIGPSDQAL